MNPEITNSTTEKHFYAKYGNEEFSVRIALYNNIGNVVFLQRNAMLYLEIDDNIFNPFHSATMILANDENLLEKAPNPYVFLGNGRDIVDIEMLPVSNKDIDQDSKDERNKEFLGLKFNFVITECTEVIYNNAICKKLTLVEYAQYMLSENICNIFDLQKSGGLVGNYLATNAGNGKTTGDIIKAVLFSVYNNGNPDESLFYVDSKTKQKIFDFESDTVLNINPYGVMSYMEILNYVLSFHSYKKSPCILQFDRYQKKFQLISLQRLFTEHKANLIETLRFPSTSQEAFSVEKSDRSDSPALNWEIFPITFEESKINEFHIESPSCRYKVDLAGNSGILSSVRSHKSMIFDLETLNSDKFMSTYYDLFVKPFIDLFKKDSKNNYELFPNFYPNPNKKNNYNTYKGALHPALNEKKFSNQKMSSLLYLNNIYQFKLIGKTHRKTLSFVDVVKTAEQKNGKYIPTTWDLNNQGRHLVTSVKHIFDYNTYRNEIETIKPYRLVDGKDNGVSLEDFLKQGV